MKTGVREQIKRGLSARRERNGLTPETEVELVETVNKIVVRKSQGKTSFGASVVGILRGRASGKTTDEIMKQLRGR